MSSVKEPVAKDLTTKEDVQEIVDKATERINLLLIGVIVVLFIGFLTLLFSLAGLMIQAWQYRTPTYQSLIDQLQQQNDEIKSLSSEIQILNKK